MTSNKQIKVAIAGIGNCAQALLEGLEHYRQHPDDTRGLMNPDMGGYANKVGKDLNKAIYGAPNNAYRYPGVTVAETGVTVQMAEPHDGNPPHLAELVPLSDAAPCDIAQVLTDSGAEMLLNFIPTESHNAARMFADAAIKEANADM